MAVWEGPGHVSVAPFEDRVMGQEPRNAGGFLEGGKGNGINSLLQSPEEYGPVDTSDLVPCNPFQTSDLQNLKMRNPFVLSHYACGHLFQ